MNPATEGVQREDVTREACAYPSGDEERDRIIELLCDEWPYEVDYREWDDRCAIVVRLLDVLDKNRLTVIDLGEPITADDLRALMASRHGPTPSPAVVPDPTLRRIYPCWCDGQDGCDGTTFDPFGLCDECTKFGHGRLPRMGLTVADLEAMVYGSDEHDA